MRILILFFLFSLLAPEAFADTPPPGTVNAKIQDSAGNALTSTSGALNVNVSGSGSSTVDQGNSGSESWLVDVTNSSIPVTGTFWQTTQPVSGTLTCNAGSGTLNTNVTNASIPVTGTFWQSTQPVSGTLTCNAGTGTLAVSVASLPLPAGASTSSLQTTGNTTLSAISGQLPSTLGAKTTANSISVNIASDQTVPVSGSLSVTNTANGNPGSAAPSQATQIGGTDGTNLRALSVSGAGVLNVAASSLPLPTGAATNAELITIDSTLGSPFQSGGSIGNTSFAATQGTAANLNATVVGPSGVALAKDSSLTTINTTLGTPMQNTGGTVAATQSGNWNLQYNTINGNGTLSSRQTVTTSETSVAAPTNAVGVLVECESVNADNLRWGFSGSSSNILSSTLGVLCEPGRDTGYLPIGVGAYLHLISTGGGSDFADVQWLLTH